MEEEEDAVAGGGGEGDISCWWRSSVGEVAEFIAVEGDAIFVLLSSCCCC